ncbi:MAG: fibronectin type III domain-containing protein, partial [Paludibacteraceae bacterium]|nr:fibronectin type III domain-containing protein [Paludibacteraceae bacterium]
MKKIVAFGTILLLSTMTAWSQILSEMCERVYKPGGNDEVILTIESELDVNGDVTDVIFTVAPHGATSSAWLRGGETTQNFLALAGDATRTPNGSYTQTVHFPTPQPAGTQVTFTFAWGTDLNGTCWDTNETYTLGGVCCVSGDHVNPTLTSGAVSVYSDTQLTLTMSGSDQDDCARQTNIVEYAVTYGGNTYTYPVEDAAGMTFTIPGLTPDTEYSFSVEAIDKKGNHSAPVVVPAHTWKHNVDYYCGYALSGAGSDVSLIFETLWSGTPQASNIVGFEVSINPVSSPGVRFRGNYITNQEGLSINGVALGGGDYTMTQAADAKSCRIDFTTPIAYDPANPPMLTWGCTEWSELDANGVVTSGPYTNTDQTIELGNNCCRTSEDNVNPVLTAVATQSLSNSEVAFTITATDQDGCGYYKSIPEVEITYGGTPHVVPVVNGVAVLGGLADDTEYEFTVVAFDVMGNRSSEVVVTEKTWQHSFSEYCNGQTMVNGAYQVSLVFDTQWSGTPQASSITGFTVEIYPITEPGTQFRNNYITGQEGLSINGVALVKNTDYTIDTSSPTVGVITFTTPIAYDPANPPVLTWGCTEWNDVAADGTVGAGRYTNDDHSISLGGNCCKTAEDNVAPVLTAVSAQGLSDTEMQFTFTATDQDACGYANQITQAVVTYGGNNYPITVVDGVGVLGGLTGETTYNFTVTVGDMANNFSNSLPVTGTTFAHPNSEFCGYVEKTGDQAAAFTVESVFDGSGQVTAVVVEIEPAGTNTWARFRGNGIRTNDFRVNDVVVPVTATMNPSKTQMTITFDTPIQEHDIVKWFLVEWATSGNADSYANTHDWVYTAGGLCCQIDDTVAPTINTCPIATGEIWGNSVDLVVDATDDNGCGRLTVPTIYEVTVNGVTRTYSGVSGGSFTAYGLSPNTTQTVSVKAVDKAGNKSAACDITVTTIDKPKNYYCAPQITSSGGIPVNLLGETLWEGEPGNSSIAGIRFYISSP